jgi:hypothetical protein
MSSGVMTLKEIIDRMDAGRRMTTTLLQRCDIGLDPTSAVKELAPTLSPIAVQVDRRPYCPRCRPGSGSTGPGPDPRPGAAGPRPLPSRRDPEVHCGPLWGLRRGGRAHRARQDLQGPRGPADALPAVEARRRPDHPQAPPGWCGRSGHRDPVRGVVDYGSAHLHWPDLAVPRRSRVADDRLTPTAPDEEPTL